MAEEENSVEEKPKSGEGKGLLIALIALVVLLLIAVVGGGYFLYSQGVFSGQQTTQEIQQEADPSETFKSEINDLVLNITNSKGREKLMKLSFAIKSSDPLIQTLIDENNAEVVDLVIGLISARSSEELLTVGGKALLKEELKEEVNSLLNKLAENNEDIVKDSVQNILFTTFVIK